MSQDVKSQEVKNTCCGCGKPRLNDEGEIIHESCDRCRLTGKTHLNEECQRGWNNYCSELVWCDVHDENYVDGDDSGADMDENDCYCMVCSDAVEIRQAIDGALKLPSEIVSLIVPYSVGAMVCSM